MSDEWLELDCDEVCELLSSDGLVASEDLVCDSILKWLEHHHHDSNTGKLLEFVEVLWQKTCISGSVLPAMDIKKYASVHKGIIKSYGLKPSGTILLQD